MKIIDRYFLPTTTNSVHASTIAFFEGHPVFSWFGGTREGNPDVSIYIYNLHNKKETIVIGNNDHIPRWNPVLVNIGKRLFLFEKAGKFCDRWNTFIHDITDWTPDITNKEVHGTEIVLPAGLNGPVKTKPIFVGDKMYCGSSVETEYDWTSYVELYDTRNNKIEFLSRSNPLSVKEKNTFVDFNGVTRKSLGIIQPCLWSTSYSCDMKSFFRSSRNLGKIYYSESDGDCMFWDEPKPTNLDNPNSGIDTIYYNGELYLAHNPSSVNRFPLVISKISHSKEDKFVFDINDRLEIQNEVTENNPCISKELSYPFLIENGGYLHLVYTYGRVAIEYIKIQI